MAWLSGGEMDSSSNSMMTLISMLSCWQKISGNHQAAISRRLLGRQSLPNLAVTDATLRTRTHVHGIPGLGMLQSNYPSVKSVLREMDSTCKRCLAYAIKHEGLLHIRWDCVGGPGCGHTSSRSGHGRTYAPELPLSVREVIKQVFPDHADIVG